jgi:hypothetical protein
MADRSQNGAEHPPDEEVLRHEREIRARLAVDLQGYIDAWFDRLGMYDAGDVKLLGLVIDTETREQHAYAIRLLAIHRAYPTQMSVMPLSPDMSRAKDHYFHGLPEIVDRIADLPELARIVAATNPDNPETEILSSERFYAMQSAWERETGLDD